MLYYFWTRNTRDTMAKALARERKNKEQNMKKKHAANEKREEQHGTKNKRKKNWGTKKGHAPELALPALAADGIDLVDEDDARSVLPGLLEQVAHSPGADPDEHLYEVGTWQHIHEST